MGARLGAGVVSSEGDGPGGEVKQTGYPGTLRPQTGPREAEPVRQSRRPGRQRILVERTDQGRVHPRPSPHLGFLSSLRSCYHNASSVCGDY